MEKHIETFRAALADKASLRDLTEIAKQIGAAVLSGTTPLPDFTPDEIDRIEDGTVLGHEKVLYDGPDLVASLLETRPGNVQPPHDHRVDVIIVGLAGVECHHMSGRTGDQCAPAGQHLLRPGETMHLGPQAIHAIDAAGDEPALALHLYLGPLDSPDRTMFDLNTGAARTFDLDAYYAQAHRA